MPDTTNSLLIVIIVLLVLLIACASRLFRTQQRTRLDKTTPPAPTLHTESPLPASPPTLAHQLLTPREREIAYLAARGLTNRQIATETGLSINTVGNHLKRVYAKLEINSRTELSWRLQYLDMNTDDPPDVDGSPPPGGG